MKSYTEGMIDGYNKCEGTLLSKLRQQDLAIKQLKLAFWSEILKIITFGAHKSLLQKEYEATK